VKELPVSVSSHMPRGGSHSAVNGKLKPMPSRRSESTIERPTDGQYWGIRRLTG